MIPEGSSLYQELKKKKFGSEFGCIWILKLDVPKFAETRLNARKITGQSLFWTGLATGSVGLGLGMNYYIQGQRAYQASADAEVWDDFKGHRAELNDLESQYNASMLTFVGGIGLMGLGYAIGFYPVHFNPLLNPYVAGGTAMITLSALTYCH